MYIYLHKIIALYLIVHIFAFRYICMYIYLQRVIVLYLPRCRIHSKEDNRQSAREISGNLRLNGGRGAGVEKVEWFGIGDFVF